MFHLIYFVTALVFFTASFLILRRVRRDYRERQILTPLTAFLQLLMFCLHAVLVNLSYGLTWAWPPLNRNPYMAAVGVLMAGIGVVIFALALQIFGPIKRMLGLKVDELKVSGIYRWSRNPQIVGYGLLLLAFLILWPSWRVAVALLVYAVIAHRMVTVEEEHLRTVHGEDYAQYCAHTPRYFILPK